MLSESKHEFFKKLRHRPLPMETNSVCSSIWFITKLFSLVESALEWEGLLALDAIGKCMIR